MGKITKSFYNKVHKGTLGHNVGILSGLPVFDKLTYGLQRECLYTIMADSGSGKTTFTLYTTVYRPLMDSLETGSVVDLLFLSFEMSAEAVMAKLLSLYIYEQYGVELTYANIFSMDGIISSEHLELIQKSLPWLEQVETKLTIFDKPLAPSEIDLVLREWLSKRGEFVRTGPYTEDYIAHDPLAYNIVVLDHVRLVKRVGTVKDSIDAVCEIFIYYRNKCKITGTFVQQTNRQLKSTDRKGMGTLMQLDDAADSSCTVHASEVVIGIYYPYREHMKTFDKYDIELLQDKFRILQLLKGRYGTADKNIALNFFGTIGMYKEMPPANEITDYSTHLSLIPKEIEEPKRSTRRNNYAGFTIQ